MTPTDLRLTKLLAPLILTAACTSYTGARPLEAIPLPADPEARFEVWSGGQSLQLHALRIDGDTLRGVRWWHDPACDSCQVALATSAVDSVRVPTYDGGATGALALFIAPFLLVGIFVAVLIAGDAGGT